MSSELDVSDTCKARSDQLNADDIVGGPITVTITDVAKASADQPIIISITGGHQPFKPCKTSRRTLVAAWGANAREWIGRSMTLYRDPNVKWAGDNVGGIRISHLSNITKPLELALSESKGKKKKFTVQPLTNIVTEWSAKIEAAQDKAALTAVGQSIKGLTLSAADRATLLVAYKSKGESFNRTPPPDATDLNRQHEAYSAFSQETAAGPTREQGVDMLKRMEAALAGGELSSSEFDELRTRLGEEMQ